MVSNTGAPAQVTEAAEIEEQVEEINCSACELPKPIYLYQMVNNFGRGESRSKICRDCRIERQKEGFRRKKERNNNTLDRLLEKAGVQPVTLSKGSKSDEEKELDLVIQKARQYVPQFKLDIDVNAARGGNLVLAVMARMEQMINGLTDVLKESPASRVNAPGAPMRSPILSPQPVAIPQDMQVAIQRIDAYCKANPNTDAQCINHESHTQELKRVLKECEHITKKSEEILRSVNVAGYRSAAPSPVAATEEATEAYIKLARVEGERDVLQKLVDRLLAK